MIDEQHIYVVVIRRPVSFRFKYMHIQISDGQLRYVRRSCFVSVRQDEGTDGYSFLMAYYKGSSLAMPMHVELSTAVIERVTTGLPKSN